MNEYCLGFAFNRNMVLLLLKDSPDWQKGLFNGVGGKIEAGESPLESMYREWGEETGTELIGDWNPVLTIKGEDWVVYVFAGETNYLNLKQVEINTRYTKEPCYQFNAEHLPTNIIPNVRWLIPLCLDKPSYKVRLHSDEDFQFGLGSK